MTKLAFDSGFAPVAAADARVLVLGSLPGTRSLQARQYYAQPQNAFWKIMGAVFDAGPDLAYADRLERLKACSIALWDVVAAGQRPGSLDAAIVKSSVVVNDFAAFFAVHARIRMLCFNGKTAAALYARHVVPELTPESAAIETVVLPSTSAAHAAMRFEEKLAQWSHALGRSVD